MGSLLSLFDKKCKFLSRPSPVRRLPLMSSQLTPSKTSKPKFKIKKVFHLISRDLSSLESSLRMEEPFQTTRSRRNQPFIWSLDLEEVVWDSSRSSHHSLLSLESTNVKK